MKNILFWIFLVCITTTLSAQKVYESTQTFMRKDQGNSLSVDIQGQKKNIEDVLDQKFNIQTGKKSRSMKGVTAFETARMLDVSPRELNYYYDVEKKKGVDNTCTVRLFIKDGREFLSSETDPEEMESATEILNNLQYETKVYEFELAVTEQEKIVEDVVKDHRKMIEDSIKLESRMDDLIKDMEKNSKEIEKQIVKMEEERLRLEALKSEMEAYISEEKEEKESVSRGN